MFTVEQHLDDLTRHIGLVRDACVLMGTRIINRGQIDFGRQLIGRGHIHDASKFQGIEWQYLHVGSDVDGNMMNLAIHQHVTTNTHHPECHGGIQNMPKIDVAEMVCDCYSRSQEFGTNIREWFTKVAVEKYNIDLEGKQWKWIQEFLNVLLQSSFK